MALALRVANPDPITGELAAEIGKRADPPGAFRAWALAQSWQRLCAIVRIVSGEVLRDVERAAEGEGSDHE